jgi:DNA-nicking Smr family endonuclease
MSRRRPLSDEEHALWSGFARSIKPLKGSGKPTAPSIADDGGPAEEARVAAMRPAVTRREKLQEKLPEKKAPPLAPLGRRLKQRVARGREPIDARLDLHGFTQAQAHTALVHFLRGAQADGARIVLVVTGKGTAKSANANEREPGVLKRQVPLWLALPEFRPLVVGFEHAHIGHGGQGALYIRLRRAR